MVPVFTRPVLSCLELVSSLYGLLEDPPPTAKKKMEEKKDVLPQNGG